MTSENNYKLYERLRNFYARGENISQKLKILSEGFSESEIIQYSYDLQAGSYIKHYEENSKFYETYACEMASKIAPEMEQRATVLDAGCGELTVHSALRNNLWGSLEFLATDISWSRLSAGRSYFLQTEELSKSTNLFVSDFNALPLASNSVDYVITNHALEPNGNALPIILRELLRVTAKKLFLFEPWYERNSIEGKARMDKLGYIRNLEEQITLLGATVKDIVPMENIANPLNPTACFVVEVDEHSIHSGSNRSEHFTYPGTETEMRKEENFYVSDIGFLFPIAQGIPVLLEKNAILASGYLSAPSD